MKQYKFYVNPGDWPFLNRILGILFDRTMPRIGSVVDEIEALSPSLLIATDADSSLISTELIDWIAGTTNRITVADDGDGTVTLSTPQDIHTGASPTFADLIDNGLTASKVVFTDASKKLTSTGIGTSAQFIKGDGSLDSSTYLVGESDTLNSVCARGASYIAGNITLLGITIGAHTLNATEWGYLDDLNQALKTTSNVRHALLGLGTDPISGKLLTGIISGAAVFGLDLSVTNAYPGGTSYGFKLTHSTTYGGGGGAVSYPFYLNVIGVGGTTVYPFSIVESHAAGTNIDIITVTSSATGSPASGGNIKLLTSTITNVNSFNEQYGTDITLTNTGGQAVTTYGHNLVINTNNTGVIPHTSYCFKGRINSSSSSYSKDAFVFRGSYTYNHIGDRYYGLYLENLSNAVNDPINNQIGIYIDNDALGTDANYKRWAFYNAGTNPTASKVMLALADVPVHFRDSGIYIHSNDDGHLDLTADVSIDLNSPLLYTKDIQPDTDNTYYLGKNDDDSPLAYKGLILKDQTNGNYYRIELNNGAVSVVDLTD